jgi:hypothetical protein
MTAYEQAREWDAPIDLVRHWCRRGLLDARRTGRRWEIESGNKPPYRSGSRMIVRWMEDQLTRLSR